MTVNKLIGIVLSCHFLVFGPLDRIQKALEKKEYDKVEELIIRGYEKEPNNPGFSYYHATLLFTADYPEYNPDSARLIIAQTKALFEKTDEEILQEIAEDGVTLEVTQLLSDDIRSYLFNETIEILSVSSIADFRAKYPNSPYDGQLIFKRDSLVFREVKELNSIAGYSRFIQGYPNSIFVNKADSIRDNLRFDKLASDGVLTDYYEFLKKYPQTQWREQVEDYIFKISTASNNTSSYIDFISNFSTDRLRKKAADLLYFVSSKDAFALHPSADSLEEIHRHKDTKLFPVMDRNLFGFHGSNGLQLIPYRYSRIQEDIKCGLSDDLWIYVEKEGKGLIINKQNRIVLENVEEYFSLSHDLALVSRGGSKFLYHKSGFKIVENPIEDAEAVQSKWIKVKVDGSWGLFSFSGVPIAENKYDDIYTQGNFWVFEKDGVISLTIESEISKEIEERGLTLEFKFDDLELINDSLLIGFKGDREGLLNDDLDFMVPWGDYEIHPDPSGWYLSSRQGYLLYNNTDERIIDQYYPYIESNEGWLVLKVKESDWMLIPRLEELEPSRGYDSIKLINNHSAIVVKDKTKKLIFSSGLELKIDNQEIQSFLKQPEYLTVRDDEQLDIYNSKGEKLISGEFERASFLNDTLIRVSIRNKQGIIDVNGEFLINPLFEALSEKDGLVFTLLGGKIGCYDLEKKILIEPKYEARIERINNYYLAKMDGKYGLIDQNEEEIVSFSYEEIDQWNDTSYLAFKDEGYFIMNSSEEIVTDPLEDLQLLFENDNQQLYLFVTEGKFGLLSTQNGIFLESEFSDILNIGDLDNPLFFADQHLNKAGFHVVSYVNKEGKLIFSKAYRKEEFDKILCED
ncbi:MAG: WG repeat-containing protein [Bacteroidota bacterium]